MPTLTEWDGNLTALLVAYAVVFLALAGWGVYASGRLRALRAELDRLVRERGHGPSDPD